MDNPRESLLKGVRRVVVKVGTAVLSHADGRLDTAQIARLGEQVRGLREKRIEVALVSSGAIGAGMAELGMKTRPKSLPKLQAAAAVGQGKLIGAYDSCFAAWGSHAGQVLLTRQDLDDRSRYLNAANTLNALLRLGVIPVINENDTVSVEEITFSENDILSALVTNLIRADLLIMLSVVDGLYDGRTGPDGRPHVVPLVRRVTEEILSMVSGERSAGGSGGMASKIEAAALATSAGDPAIVANGRTPDVLLRLFEGEPLGTLFLPAPSKMTSRKRWIGFTSRPRGKIVVDDGARDALVKRGKSLLPSGITEVRGQFDRGDLVAVVDTGGVQIARGLANYDSDEVRQIMGLRTAEARTLLGQESYDEVIHRDNLAVGRPL